MCRRKKTFQKCAERMRREQVPQPRNVSDRFLEIWGSRERAGNVTNQKLWNVPQISNSVCWLDDKWERSTISRIFRWPLQCYLSDGIVQIALLVHWLHLVYLYTDLHLNIYNSNAAWVTHSRFLQTIVGKVHWWNYVRQFLTFSNFHIDSFFF